MSTSVEKPRDIDAKIGDQKVLSKDQKVKKQKVNKN